MLQYAEYKAFAFKLVLIFAIALGLIVLINGLFLIAAVTQYLNDMQSGTTPERLNGLTGTGISPEQMQELGL
jgi:hypothetical protein